MAVYCDVSRQGHSRSPEVLIALTRDHSSDGLLPIHHRCVSKVAIAAAFLNSCGPIRTD